MLTSMLIHTRAHFDLHASADLGPPFVVCFVISSAAVFQMDCLKFAPSPASALCSIRNSISAASSAEVQKALEVVGRAAALEGGLWDDRV